MALYDRRLERLGVPCESRLLETAIGSTHVLVAGPEDAPPLLVVHGAHYSGPFNLAACRALLDHFRVYAPDVPGQFGRSAQTAVSARRYNYARWVVEILDAFDLGAVPCAGISFGSSILLDTAAYAPSRITRAVLIVPMGFAVNSPLRIFPRLFLPWLLYRLWPTQRRLYRALSPLAVDADEDLIAWFETIVRQVRRPVVGRTHYHRAELAGYKAPTLLILAADDVFFPSARVERRARKILPCLAGIEPIDGRHIPTGAGLERLNWVALRFLRGEVEERAR